MTGEAVRWTLVVGALVLCVTSAPGIVWAPLGWDQRLRFATMLGYGVVTAGAQLGALHVPPTPWTVLLVPVTGGAVVGGVGFLVKNVPAVLAGGGDRDPG